MRRHDTGLSVQGEPAMEVLGLSVDETLQAERVHEHLVAAIAAAGGWISFERFMEIALYAPGLGYYSAGAHKFGAGGDFTTAPEISRLFGGCVARQCAEVLCAVTSGSILEVGAGSGRLAVDVLTRLETLGQLPSRYRILEISADLRERQRSLLESCVPHLMTHVAWLDAPPDDAFDGVILANEVLDALPVARFRWSRSHCEELGVGCVNGAFEPVAKTADGAFTRRCQALFEAGGAAWDDGYVSEFCPRLGAWTERITRPLRRGAALWFDYGLPRAQYYLPERRDGTLICHFRQRAHADLFRQPGLQDISAWVDFTSLAEASRATGLQVAGFTSQAYFLAGLRIDQEMRAMAGDDENGFARLANQARRLMLPGEMGERFKAMAWQRELDLELSGFALQDLRHTL